MADFQVELRFRLNASSQHEAHLWAAEILDTKPVKDNGDVKYRDAHVAPVPTNEQGERGQ
jgi:hypothetical protein